MKTFRVVVNVDVHEEDIDNEYVLEHYIKDRLEHGPARMRITHASTIEMYYEIEDRKEDNMHPR